jgi:hypothetical protein
MVIARRMLGMAEAAICAAGHEEVKLGASLTALPFYERCGYRLLCRREWKTRGGLMLPVADMAKPLPRQRA